MATGRDDFVIAIRSAFLKKKDKQKFSLLTLIILSSSIKSEVTSPDGYRSSLSASLTVFLTKFSLNLIFDTNDYLPIATIFSTDNLALSIVS